MKKTIAGIAALLALCGCNTIYQSRTLTSADGTKEKTRTLSAAWLTKQSIEGLKASETRADGSRRSLEIEGAKLRPDPESIKASGGAIGEGGKVFITPHWPSGTITNVPLPWNPEDPLSLKTRDPLWNADRHVVMTNQVILLPPF